MKEVMVVKVWDILGVLAFCAFCALCMNRYAELGDRHRAAEAAWMKKQCEQHATYCASKVRQARSTSTN